MTTTTTTVFKDQTFHPENWQARLLNYFTPFGVPDPKARFLSDQVTFGGLEGAFRQVIHQWGKTTSHPSGAIMVQHINKNAIYEPSKKGPIAFIDFSCNLMNVDSATETKYALVLLQNGNVYISEKTFTAKDTNWTASNMSNLCFRDFRRIDSLATDSARAPAFEDHPNFSMLGAAIQFGYVTICTTNQQQDETISGIDGWKVTIFHESAETTSQQRKIMQIEHNLQVLQQELSMEKAARHNAELELKKERALRQADVKALQSRETELSEERIRCTQKVMEEVECHRQKVDHEMKEMVAQLEKKAMKGLEELHLELEAKDKVIKEERRQRQDVEARLTAMENALSEERALTASLRGLKSRLEQEILVEKDKRAIVEKEVTVAKAGYQSELRCLFSKMDGELSLERDRRLRLEKEQHTFKLSLEDELSSEREKRELAEQAAQSLRRDMELLLQDRDTACEARESLREELRRIAEERDSIQSEKAKLQSEKDKLQAERDKAAEERDKAVEERDRAMIELAVHHQNQLLQEQASRRQEEDFEFV